MRRTPLPSALAAACVFLVLAAPGCDEASPVAPPGTTLSVTATPSQIGANGTSSIRVTALKGNGTPVNPGTEVRLDTTLGTIDPIVETDSSGVAEGTLQGTGRVGMATVTARTGSAEPAMVEVEIGEFAANITLQATPTQVSEGGTVSLLALVRDDEARPLQGAAVNFLTDLGTLDSRGAVRLTNANGQVTDTLRVSAEDIESATATTFVVEAIVGGEGGALQRDQATIRIIARAPIIRFLASTVTDNIVRFVNETTGERPIDFFWDFTNNGSVDSMDESPPPEDYGSAATYTVSLRARNDFGDKTVTCSITVPISGTTICEED